MPISACVALGHAGGVLQRHANVKPMQTMWSRVVLFACVCVCCVCCGLTRSIMRPVLMSCGCFLLLCVLFASVRVWVCVCVFVGGCVLSFVFSFFRVVV
jgi:hypothetical protein